jgi:beta-1,4-mannosyltransferase
MTGGVTDDEPDLTPHARVLPLARMRVSVVVLGDLARSPRMLNHAHALAARDADVDLIGYGASLPQRTRADGRISCHILPDARATTWPWIVTAPLRAVRQSWRLFAALRRMPRPDVILVQTPPALPTLPIALAAARLHSARLIVDWHNLTSSLVALRLGAGHPLVKAVAWCERACGRRASGALVVSQAMHDVLRAWGIARVQVMRDRPGDGFRPQPPATRGALLANMFGAAHQHQRLVVMPSSWSDDDDLDLLRTALDRCESMFDARERTAPARAFPSIAVVLTGDGPRRARYQPLFEQRASRRVHARVVWLSAEDYERIIGCADLGISVHRSASGIDLPMKICDLFGGGVPVCALDYGPCLGELVEDGRNGALFRTADELAALLCDLLDDTPESAARLASLGRGAAASGAVRWQEGWAAEAWPVLAGAR